MKPNLRKKFQVKKGLPLRGRFGILPLVGALLIAVAGCSSQPVLPIADSIKVGRETPDAKNCEEIGPISGTTGTRSGTSEQALEDLKKEAALKGATYVKVEQYSGYGSSVTGIAYKCR